VIASLLLIASPSFGKDVVEKRTAKEPLATVKNIPFAEVDGKEILLDLRVPKNVQRPPLVVWIHGGGWEIGDKKKCRSCWLVNKGFHEKASSVNYQVSFRTLRPPWRSG
jgi:acetyl esterase/lipase